jgi:hypothetical protein
MTGAAYRGRCAGAMTHPPSGTCRALTSPCRRRSANKEPPPTPMAKAPASASRPARWQTDVLREDRQPRTPRSRRRPKPRGRQHGSSSSGCLVTWCTTSVSEPEGGRGASPPTRPVRRNLSCGDPSASARDPGAPTTSAPCSNSTTLPPRSCPAESRETSGLNERIAGDGSSARKCCGKSAC